MSEQELCEAREEAFDNLDQIIQAYHSTDRKNKKLLALVCLIGAAAVYWLAFDFLGGFWGYVVTIALVGIGVYCFSQSFSASASISDPKLAYTACIAMEKLIKIHEGTYCASGIHIIGISTGTHKELYRQFIRYYPNWDFKALRKLSNINIHYKDL